MNELRVEDEKPPQAKQSKFVRGTKEFVRREFQPTTNSKSDLRWARGVSASKKSETSLTDETVKAGTD